MSADESGGAGASVGVCGVSSVGVVVHGADDLVHQRDDIADEAHREDDPADDALALRRRAVEACQCATGTTDDDDDDDDDDNDDDDDDDDEDEDDAWVGEIMDACVHARAANVGRATIREAFVCFHERQLVLLM